MSHQPCTSSSFTAIATTDSSGMGMTMTSNPLSSTSSHSHQNIRKPRLPSQTSESLMSVGDDSVKSSERRRVTPEEVTEENKRVSFIVGLATGLIFLSAFILIAVTLKMTPKIDEIQIYNFLDFQSIYPTRKHEDKLTGLTVVGASTDVDNRRNTWFGNNNSLV